MNIAKYWQNLPPQKIILFGNGSFASLLWHRITHDTPHSVVAFSVDRQYIASTNLHGLPAVAFDEIERHFDPSDHKFLPSIGWAELNGLREQRTMEALRKGYELTSYVSSRAIVCPETEIGAGCMIFDAAIIQPFARLGDGVILRSGSNISHHVHIDEYCFVSSEAVIGGNSSLGRRCFVGLNATIIDNVKIGNRVLVGAGATITRDLSDDAAFAGLPARPVVGR